MHSIEGFLKEGILLSPDVVASLAEYPSIFEQIDLLQYDRRPLVLNGDVLSLLQRRVEVDWMEFDKTKVVFERSGKQEPYRRFLQAVNGALQAPEPIAVQEPVLPAPQTQIPFLSVKVMRSFEAEERKLEFKDFVNIFKSRYDALRKILQLRPELQNVSSINRLGQGGDSRDAGVIGLVYDRTVTKNGNILLRLEDATGLIRVLINKSSSELTHIAELVCLDEVIGVVGTLRDNFIFAKNILFPEVSHITEKRCHDDAYAAFISDIHVGSTMFLENEFCKLIRWLNGKEGDEQQRMLGLKVRYLFIIGDLVDGIGVFPNQEKYLQLKDIREQYTVLAKLLREIRKDVQIIICPGQHDSIRVAEPQPVLDKDFAAPLWELSNVLFVSNPAMVTIHSTPNFEGFHVLMYHGASFHYYVDTIPMLRASKARDNPSHVLRLLLQKRHLAPTYSSTIYVPTNHEDALVITQTPDIFVCGEMHRSDVSHYNGVLTINCSCWQSKTDFQEKTGNNPDPCKVPLFHFQTQQVTIMSFDQ